MVLSHGCHKTTCLNVIHHELTVDGVNGSRNNCAKELERLIAADKENSCVQFQYVAPKCIHRPKCIKNMNPKISKTRRRK